MADRRINEATVVAGLLAALATSMALTGCTSQANTAGGVWQPLFNGQDLAGWSVKCKPADQGKGFWRVEDGAIVADSLGHTGHDYVWLVTDNEYSDFLLRIHFQAYRKSPGNGGIQIRSRYDDLAGWLDGPQIDINPPGPWRTGMIWDETRGSGRWLFPDLPKGQWVNEKMANPDLTFYYAENHPATWNSFEVRAVGLKVTARLNGVIVTDFDGTGILDNEVHRRHRVGVKGHIALQIHKNDQLKMRFRDISIRDLAPR